MYMGNLFIEKTQFNRICEIREKYQNLSDCCTRLPVWLVFEELKKTKQEAAKQGEKKEKLKLGDFIWINQMKWDGLARKIRNEGDLGKFSVSSMHKNFIFFYFPFLSRARLDSTASFSHSSCGIICQAASLFPTWLAVLLKLNFVFFWM